MTIAKEILIEFLPCNKKAYVLPGTTLLEAAERVGIILEAPCGGKGTCGKCKVRIVEGETDASPHRLLEKEEIDAGYCLACLTHVYSDTVIDVPPESKLGSNLNILTEGGQEDIATVPTISKHYFSITPPTREDARSDMERLQSDLDVQSIPYPILKEIPRFLRNNDWKGTATLCDNELIALEKGDTSAQLYGVAFDIGTTSIVGALFDLASGLELCVESEMNPQSQYGADVISRIEHIRSDFDKLEEMRRATLNILNSIIARLCKQSSTSKKSIFEAVLTGNSTMQEITLGMDPSPLGELPFVQAFKTSQRMRADEVGLDIHPGAKAVAFPQIGGFVGGDTVAAMLTAEIDQYENPVLLIDIGTNGEIVLASRGEILATSTAAGPALEGAKIEHGMRATDGAIEKVLVQDNELVVNVIGNVKPRGLCGSGLIDITAILLRYGILKPQGRFQDPANLDANVPEDLKRRIRKHSVGFAFDLAEDSESGTTGPVSITQKDISEIQLAVGSIRAGIDLLLEKLDLSAEDLEEVLLAGAFGNYIRIENARRIGLLPQLSEEKIRFIGNAALHGAKKMLLIKSEREYADTLCARTKHIDLSLDPCFQDTFVDAMVFPCYTKH